MTHFHDVVMENWLAGKDLAYDHKNSGAIGHYFYHDLLEELRRAYYADVDTLSISLPVSAAQQSFDALTVVRGAGFKLVVQ